MFFSRTAQVCQVLITVLMVAAVGAQAMPDRKESVLLPSPDASRLSQYDTPFNELHDRSKLRIKIYGLRLVPLHPSVWGTLKRERTNNRTMVPIKRYFLRASEAPGFELLRLATVFSFKKTDQRYMERMPHQKDPVFEIGVGGRFEERNLSEKPIQDRFITVRLSAFPSLESGIFERKQERFALLASLAGEPLSVGRKYKVDIEVSGDTLELKLDGNVRATYSEPGLASGLLSLQTSWHPISMEELKITARGRDGDDAPEVREYSGLVSTAP